MVGAGAPIGAAEPSPGQVWLSLANCSRLWRAAAGSSQWRPAVVRPSLARCSQPCTFALVQPSKVHLFIVIPIFLYLQVKIPTNLVEPH
jgi:hypothetical protein